MDIWAAEILGLGLRVHTLHGGEGALRRGDARGGVHMVDGDGEGRTVVVGVDLHHLPRLISHRFLSTADHGHRRLSRQRGNDGMVGASARTEVDLGFGVVSCPPLL